MSSYVALAMMISGLDFEVITNENTDPLAHFTAATFSFKSDRPDSVGKVCSPSRC